jgi:hypothetical protein
MGTMSKRVTYAFTALMIAALIVPLIAGNLGSPTTQTVEPTEIAIPTFPPPMTDFSGIEFSEQYLHPSGLFAVGVPTGWNVVPSSPAGPTGAPEVNMNNTSIESTIAVLVEAGGEAIQSPADLSGYFNSSRLAGSWPRFQGGQRELRRDEMGDRLVIEFALTDSQRREYFARHASWTDGEWIYTARVVVPNNATRLLDFMLDPVITSVQPMEQFKGTPVTWSAFYDEINKHILRHPTSWRITDGGEDGQFTSFSSLEGVEAFVTSEETPLADEAAAREWVESLRGGISVDDIQPVTRPGGEGWAATYTYTDFEGTQRSGYAVLLNGEDGKLHVASALLPEGGLNLLTEDTSELGPYAQTAQVLNTFSLVTGLNLPEPASEESSAG